MKSKIFILLIPIINISLNIYIYQPEEIINFLNKKIIPEDTLNFIINNLEIIFNDIYAYTEISKNPPQPIFDKNYFSKIDIPKRLRNIKIKNQNFYNFYQELMEIFGEIKDGHIFFDPGKFFPYLSDLFIQSPFNLCIKKINNDTKILAQLYDDIKIKNSFKNSIDIYKTIENNINIPIKSINGQDPFNFITSFGKKYINFKSPYGSFTLKYLQFNNYPLILFPLSIEKLSNFTVVYENGDYFVTDLIILSQINIENNDSEINEDKLKLYFQKNFEYNEFKLNKDEAKEKNMNNNLNFYLSDKNWNYNFHDIFKCRVDENNKVNVYFINSFTGGEDKLFFEKVEKCALLFDNNTYPIILITSLNKGGANLRAQILLEALSPLLNVNFYAAYRKTNSLLKYAKIERFDTENCKLKNYKELAEKGIKINYGNNITDTLTQPFIISGKKIRKKINLVKYKLKNKRKPTDILVFTDGFSFSSMSLFIKLLQYYGGGIVVGYFGNPNIKNIPFDSSLSPSGVFKNDTLYNISPDAYKKLHDKYGITMTITGAQFFYNPKDLKIPIEYDINPVDEKVDIYELFTERNYNIFIQEGIKILNKYKTNCNPKNKRLVLVDSKCDIFFENNYTHGGYECGDEGKWIKTCVPSYCDIGYIFDHIKKKCIIDVCSVNNKMFYIIISLTMITISVFLVVFFFIIVNKNYNKDKLNPQKYQSLELGYLQLDNNNKANF